MIRQVVQVPKKAFGLSREPLAVFVDSSNGARVRYELFPRFISRTALSAQGSESDALYFMSGFKTDTGSIRESIGIADRERTAKELAQLDKFLEGAVTCVEEFQKAGIPPFAPMATPGINEIFFRKGEEFVTTKKIPVRVRVSYFAPCAGGGEGHLPAGTRVVVAADSEDYTRSTSCELLEPFYSELEESLVSRDQRTDGLYAGYALSIDSGVLQDHCKPVERETEPNGGESKEQ